MASLKQSERFIFDVAIKAELEEGFYVLRILAMILSSHW